MGDLILALSAILPLFLPMAAGYLIKRIGLIDQHTAKQMNGIVFRFFLPLLLCYNVYHSDLSSVFQKTLLLTGAGGVAGSFLLLFLFVRLIEKDPAKQGVMVQGMFRSNFVLFGLPLAGYLCGTEGLGPTALMIAVVIPMFNVLSVIVLEMCRGGAPDIKKITKGIVTNPLILSSALGLLLLFSKIPIPAMIDNSVKSIAGIATPLALFLLGASFQFTAAKGTIKQLLMVVAVKLVVLPAIMLGIGYWLGLRGIAIVTLLAMFASPTAVSSFVMAQEMEGDGALANQIVVWTSVFALFTIFLFIIGLRWLGGI